MLKINFNKKVDNKLEKLPKTPFFIKDNTDMENSLYMVVKDYKTNKYQYVNMQDGFISLDCLDDEKFILDRLNNGSDSLCTAEINIFEQ